MTQTEAKNLLDALGWIAYGKRDERPVGLNRLRNSLAFATTRDCRLGWSDHLLAKSLLDYAAEQGERVFRRKKSSKSVLLAARLRLLRRAPVTHGIRQYRGARRTSASETLCDWVTVPIIRKDGTVGLKLLGPRNADAQFLIAYAFWKAAAAVPVTSWRTFLLRKCAVCDSQYRDMRPTMRGGRNRCHSCLEKDKRKRR